MAVQANKSYVLGDYRLELDLRMLSRSGVPVRITGKPYHVLVYLIENRDRLISRAELLEQFWEGRDVYDVSLSKCISAIRKLLDDHIENPQFIETRWAEGYRYIGPFAEEFSESGQAIIEIEKTRGLKIVIEDEDSKAPPVPDASVPAEVSGSRAILALPKRSGRTAMVILAVVVMLLAVAAIIFTRSRSTPDVVNPSPIRSVACCRLRI